MINLPIESMEKKTSKQDQDASVQDCLDSVEMYKWWYTFTCTGGGVLYWTLLCCTGLYWAAIVCSGLYLTVPEYSGLYLVVLGSALL